MTSSSDGSVDTNAPTDAGPFGDALTGDASSVSDATAVIDAAVVDKSPACDTGIAAHADAPSFAKTIGICTSATTDGYGLVSATYSETFYEPDAAAVKTTLSGQASAQTSFGTTLVPREGSSLGVLSTGYAYSFDDPNFRGNTAFSGSHAGTSNGSLPSGFPKATPGCDQSSVTKDIIDVKLALKAPIDARGFRFDFDFFASDWPDFVCNSANDAFIAYVESSGFTGNIANDLSGGPLSVNSAFFDRCTPSTTTACGDHPVPDAGLAWLCSAGTTELAGTGYGLTGSSLCTSPQTTTLGGATGWLSATAPIAPGETFTIDLIVFNASDDGNDSSVLVDNFEWLSDAAVTTTRAK